MTLIGAIGFLCGAAGLLCLAIARRRSARGNVLVRRLARPMVRLHLVMGVVVFLALIALPMSMAAHRALGVLALILLSVMVGLRWRSVLDRGAERRWAPGMRIWVVAMLVMVWGHGVFGWSAWPLVALIAVHLTHLKLVWRIAGDGMIPLETARARWPQWVMALRREGEGHPIRRFGARWRMPPF